MCLSGGADGADLQWGMTAGSRGHEVIHWSYAGHRTSAPEQEVVVLSVDQLETADVRLVKANRTLKRRIPSNIYVRNLLRRNWYQVEHAERVYAVSTFEGGKVAGGTAWATQMFIDRFSGLPCECYVFDQLAAKWFCWKGEWQEIISPPIPHGIYAGVGTRELNKAGKNAIRTLMEWVKP
jgi:hypothetical protein